MCATENLNDVSAAHSASSDVSKQECIRNKPGSSKNELDTQTMRFMKIPVSSALSSRHRGCW